MKKLEQIIAENLLRFGVKNLSESNKKTINNLSEQEEDPATVTKSKSIGFQTQPQRNRMRGVQKGGAIGGATYTVTKEKDIDLVTATDMLNKMNADLTESADYKKLSIDIKNQLAAGYYDALLTILNSDVIKELSQAQKRDLKKFFRKSQRWAFETYELSDEDILKIKLQSTNELSDQQLKEAANIISTSLNDLNTANSTAGTISSNTSNSIRIYENDLEFIARQKQPLSTILVNIEKGLGQKTLKAAQTVGVVKPVTLSIPKNTKVFAVNKLEVVAAEAANMAKTIENQILNNMFSVTEGKQVITKSGRDIVEAGGVLKVNLMNIISSASNYYGGMTDFSHSNDGKPVKSFDSINSAASSGKNKNLAKQRNTSLQQAIVLQLQKVSWLDLSQTTFTNDVRITDTGGVIDENRNKSTHPNPGQYGQLALSISGQIEYQQDQPGSYSRSASFRQFGIRLRYIGKRETERSLQMGLIAGGVDKAQLVKARPIKTALQNLGMVLTTDSDQTKLKSNPNSLKVGGNNWQNKRTDQNVRKGASGGY